MPRTDLPLADIDIGSVIAMDDPRHARLRSVVARGFTPRTIAKVDEYVKAKAAEIITRIQQQFPNGECDFVEHVAAPLPLEIICEMMGIPQSDFAQILAWTNVILGVGDPEAGGTFDTLLENSMAMFAYAQALGEDRLANRRDDITSELMHADVDGERMTSQEFGSFFILLVAAGNETTRNAISHGMKTLTDLPEQKEIWWNDFDNVARISAWEPTRPTRDRRDVPRDSGPSAQHADHRRTRLPAVQLHQRHQTDAV